MIFSVLVFVVTAMQAEEVLLEDPRIAEKEYTEEQSQALITTVNKATDEEKECLFGYINDYERDIYYYCQANKLAGEDPIGCEKMVGYSLHEAVLEAALNKCGVNWRETE